jgi:DNA-binding NtrC family response regulator
MKIKSLKESEKEHLLNVLTTTHWDLDKASRLLKISLPRLKSKIKAYDLSANPIRKDLERWTNKGENV